MFKDILKERLTCHIRRIPAESLLPSNPCGDLRNPPWKNFPFFTNFYYCDIRMTGWQACHVWPLGRFVYRSSISFNNVSQFTWVIALEWRSSKQLTLIKSFKKIYLSYCSRVKSLLFIGDLCFTFRRSPSIKFLNSLESLHLNGGPPSNWNS